MVMEKIWAIQRWIRFRDIISNMSEELIENMSYTLFVSNKYIILQKSDIISSSLFRAEERAKKLPKFLWEKNFGKRTDGGYKLIEFFSAG